MNQFDKFDENLYYLLKQSEFQPSRFVFNKYGKSYNRSDYKKDKTMGCRGTAFYTFASLTNHKDDLNKDVFKRQELDSFIEKYELISPSKTINSEIVIPNKSIGIVALFANVFNMYYVPWHTFIIIRFDNPSGNNFKIIQSWNDEQLIISVNEMSSGWVSNPSDAILSIVKNRDIDCWEQLFNHKTVYNLLDENSIKKIRFKFNFQLLIDDIEPSWYN